MPEPKMTYTHTFIHHKIIKKQAVLEDTKLIIQHHTPLLKDIEARWSENAQGLPPGVLEALKTVTPPNGRLSFERFVGGLRIALVRAR